MKDASNGDPIAYVTISIPDKSVGAYTDSLGRFMLKVKDPGPIMRVALVGYEPQQISLSKKKRSNVLTSGSNRKPASWEKSPSAPTRTPAKA